MKRLIIKSNSLKMETIYELINRAKLELNDSDCMAVYNFNGIELLIKANTDTKLLARDYNNSSYLGLKSVGPECVKKYSKHQ